MPKVSSIANSAKLKHLPNDITEISNFYRHGWQ